MKKNLEFGEKMQNVNCWKKNQLKYASKYNVKLIKPESEERTNEENGTKRQCRDGDNNNCSFNTENKWIQQTQ